MSQGASIPVQIYSYFYLISAPLDFYSVDSTSNRELLVMSSYEFTDKLLVLKILNPFCKVMHDNSTEN